MSFGTFAHDPSDASIAGGSLYPSSIPPSVTPATSSVDHSGEAGQMSKCESKCESPCRKSCESKQGGSAGTADSAPRFIDRRRSGSAGNHGERRQFGSSHAGLSPEATELAVAIDRYKLARRRRYITCEEMLAVIKELGYCRPGSQP